MVLEVPTPVAPRHVLRGYQQRIVDEVSQGGNSVIVLPTGAGKTHTAAEVVRLRLAEEPGRSIVFFVPTTHLVVQQATVLESWLEGYTFVHQFRGGQALPTADFRVLVTTPDAFQAAVSSGSLPGEHAPALIPEAADPVESWARYSLFVFDEVHHHLKDHPYRRVVSRLKGTDERLPKHLTILGLTATLSYAVKEKEMQKSIAKLQLELEIKQIATCTAEELEGDGYHGLTTKSNVDLPAVQTPGVLPVELRAAHAMLPIFLGRCMSGEATLAARLLLRLSEALEQHAANIIGASFVPPNRDADGSGYTGIASWGTAAGKLYQNAVDHGAGRGATAAKVRALEWLMHSYEAVRMAVVSWEEQAAEGAAMYLRMNGIVPGSPVVTQAVEHDGIPDEVVALLVAYYDAAAASGTPRFDHLRSKLLELYRRRRLEGATDAAVESSSLHGVVFVEQRLMAHVVAWYVGTYDCALSACFNTAVIHADTPATHLLRMTKAQGRKSIDRFRTKEANLLVATNAAEEGMDIPEANAVVRFDPISTAVSLVQGRGRAREAHSDFMVLDQRHDRTVATLQEAERKQSTFIQQAFGGAEGGGLPGGAAVAGSTRSESELKASQMQSQIDREAANRNFLRQHFDSPTQLLNTFCQKVRLHPDFNEGGTGTHFESRVRVTSITFGTIEGHGTSTSKKGARDAASASAIEALRAQFDV